jgi:hypothetical protein
MSPGRVSAAPRSSWRCAVGFEGFLIRRGPPLLNKPQLCEIGDYGYAAVPPDGRTGDALYAGNVAAKGLDHDFLRTERLADQHGYVRGAHPNY